MSYEYEEEQEDGTIDVNVLDPATDRLRPTDASNMERAEKVVSEFVSGMYGVVFVGSGGQIPLGVVRVRFERGWHISALKKLAEDLLMAVRAEVPEAWSVDLKFTMY
jgi:hypothetical protein